VSYVKGGKRTILGGTKGGIGFGLEPSKALEDWEVDNNRLSDIGLERAGAPMRKRRRYNGRNRDRRAAGT